MPQPHVFKWYAVEDARIATITADPEGGVPAFGTLLDVPGIKTVGLSGTIENKKLRGDNRLLDSSSILTGLALAVENAKVSLDVLAAMIGYEVTDLGVSPTSSVQAELTAANAAIKPFYFESKTPTGGTTIGGDGHMVMWKCVLTKFPEIGHAEEDYKTISFEADVIPLASTGKWHRIVANETAKAIAAVAV